MIRSDPIKCKKGDAMNLSYALKLWGRNIAGAFRLPHPHDKEMDRNQGHIYFTILTGGVFQLFGATIKTIIDLSSRRFTSTEVIEEQAAKLNNLDDVQLKSLISEIEKVSFASRSSQKLQYALYDLKADYNSDVNRLMRNKIFEFESQKITEAKSLLNNENYKVSYSANTEEKQQIRTENKEELSNLFTTYQDKIKECINRFILQPHNNGKKLHQVIMRGIDEAGKTPQEQFILRTEKEMARLEKKEGILDFRTKEKKQKIENAISSYKEDPSSQTKQAVNDALAIKRFGVFSCVQTNAEKAVGDELLKLETSAPR